MRVKFATVSPFIDKYHPKQNGTCAISIRVTYDGQKKYYGTPLSLTPDDFEKITGNRPRGEYKELYRRLDAFTDKAQKAVDNLKDLFTFEAFETAYLSRRNKDGVFDLLIDYIDNLKQSGQVGTATAYSCTLNSMKDYTEGKPLRIREVNQSFLEDYESWMRSNGRSAATIGIYTRALRRIYNVAIQNGIVSKELYPFGADKYETPTASSVKKALSVENIARIFHYEATSIPVERAKDFWVFIYLCAGINVKDMCRLQYGNIIDSMLEFVRAKTARTKRKETKIRIPMEPEAMAIIQKYGQPKVNDETYIFPILEQGISAERERQLIQQITHVTNDHLKTIAKDLGLKNLTTYTARHSFATVLKNSGASTEFIGEMLGHSNVKTTQGYLAGFENKAKKEKFGALTNF